MTEETDPKIMRLVRGDEVPMPYDLPDGLPPDIEIIAKLIDANCRAYSDAYGYHLDSRCLPHYNEGILRLAQAGLVSLRPMLERDGSVKMTKDGKPVLFDQPVDDPRAQTVRVRAQYVPFEMMTNRPSTDPTWALQAQEITRLRAELKATRGDRDPRGYTINEPPEEPDWSKSAPPVPLAPTQDEILIAPPDSPYTGESGTPRE